MAVRQLNSTPWCGSTLPVKPITTGTAASCSTCCATCSGRASGDRKRGAAGRGGAPPEDRGDRKRGAAGRGGSPREDLADRAQGQPGSSGGPAPSNP